MTFCNIHQSVLVEWRKREFNISALLQTTHGYKHGKVYPERRVGYQILSFVSPREVTGTPKDTVDADAHKKSEEKCSLL